MTKYTIKCIPLVDDPKKIYVEDKWDQYVVYANSKPVYRISHPIKNPHLVKASFNTLTAAIWFIKNKFHVDKITYTEEMNLKDYEGY